MASLDVESLFTNVPLDETTDIIVEQIYGTRMKENNILKSDFRKLLEFATKGSVFIFDGQYFRQVDGVAMGLPLGPAYANAFLCYH